MILLFDVDGVLVDNRAYRAGIRYTTQYFAERLGLQVEPPTDADIDVFESQTITVEWDTCAIITAVLLLERLGNGAHSEIETLPGDFWAALGALPLARPAQIETPKYAELARSVGATARRLQCLPSPAALVYLAQEQSLPEKAKRLLESLLGHVYAIDRSPAMQVFQSFVLGDDHYSASYGRAPVVHGAPLLQKLDTPLLTPTAAEAVLAGRAAHAVYPVIYTARPSLPPVEAGPGQRGYTPESEMAASVVGLDGVPVMGRGKVEWYAQRVGRNGAELVKPSPVQAMAAIAAARTGLEIEAVKAALAVIDGEPAPYPLTACQDEAVHVFDDSPGGLKAVGLAVELLNRHRLGLRLTCHGIARPGSPKHAALAEVADCIHPDVNEGVREVLGLKMTEEM